MGKKSNIAAVFSKWIGNVKTDRSKLLKSVVSLVLASVILVTCTVCWYYIKTAYGKANNFTLDAGKGLRVNDTGTSQFNSAENDFELLPASSVDGRNLYFPTDGTDFSNVAKDMTFRSANAGDKNVNYIQIDFKVTAQANHTSIYLNPDKTWLKVYNEDDDENHTNASAQQAAPLRMAIWCTAPEKDGSAMTPVVFNSQEKTVTTPAVNDVDRGSGAYLGSSPQIAHQFSDYAVGGTPLATLSAGKETTFSVIIWLEGNDPKCTRTWLDPIDKSDIYLGLAFKTSWDDTDVIRFKDATTDGWIRNKLNSQSNKYNLTVRFTDATDSSDVVDFNTYQYRQTSDEWTASIPSDMTNKITFILSPPAGSNDTTVYTFCRQTGSHSTSTENRGVNRQYIVEDASANNIASECEGRWVPLGDSDGGGVDIGDLDGDDF
ncbi:MAG: hypothetical protein IJT79_03980 [Ruminococcus sp.]|nr:hypothetical protein [Ruminococcus sp.]